jgi:NitT/TauT family transport system substrate-binding protein
MLLRQDPLMARLRVLIGDFCLCLAAFAVLATQVASASTVRLAVRKTGTLSWELNVIRTDGLDRKAGLTI